MNQIVKEEVELRRLIDRRNELEKLLGNNIALQILPIAIGKMFLDIYLNYRKKVDKKCNHRNEGKFV